jgi:hypothetical protein
MDSRTSHPPRRDAAQETAAGEAQPQDKHSPLVEREWVRMTRRGGKQTERPMIGQEVTATFVDPPGDLFGVVRTVSGIVRRNRAGKLVIGSDDGTETPVPRDANVTVRGR